MRRLRRYIPLALLLTFVMGSRPQCEQRASTETYAPAALRLPGNACSEIIDPTGRDWADLASATPADTFESIWLRVERRATGTRVFICASDEVPLLRGLQMPIDVVRTSGETGRSVLSLDTGDVVSVSAWSDPPVISSGDTAQLHLDVSGGSPPYTYRWTGNVSDPAIANPTTVATGRFYVWVFDSFAEERTVPLRYSYTMVDVGAMLPDTHALALPDTIDPGGSAMLDLSPRPNSAWWSPNATLNNPYTITPVATPANTTQYSAVAIYPGGSMNLGVRLTVRMSVDATANPPSISAGGYSVLRATGIVGGHESVWFHKFVWSPAHGLDDVFGQSRSVRPTETTTYTVHMIDIYGQLATDTVTVEVTP